MVHLGCDRLHEPLEWGAGQEHIDGLLIPLDLSEGDGARLEAELLLLLHTSFGRGSLLDGLGRLDLVGQLGSGLGLGGNFGLGHGERERSTSFFEFNYK